MVKGPRGRPYNSTPYVVERYACPFCKSKNVGFDFPYLIKLQEDRTNGRLFKDRNNPDKCYQKCFDCGEHF